MSAEVRPQLTDEISGTLPLTTGDRFRPNDYILDKRAIRGKLGDAISLFAKTPSIVSGCVVSQGTGTTISVTAGEALIFNDLVTSITLHNYNAAAIGPVTQPKYIAYLPVSSTTNQTVSPLTQDGITLHYVKLRINRDLVIQRNRAGDAALYDAFVAEAVQIVIDQTAPATNDIELARFTSLAGTFSISTTNRGSPAYSKALNDRLLVSATRLEVGADGGDIAGLDFSITADRDFEFPDRDHRVGALENWVASANYEINDHAVNTGILYRCTIANNDAVFDTGKWQVVGGSGGSSLIHSFSQAAPTLVIGNPVYYDGTDWQKAQANANTTVAIGLISEAAAPDYKVQYGGSITLTTGQWDALTGGSGGLIPGTTYYTDPDTAGALTDVVPAIANPVIFAISATEAFVVPYFNAAESGVGNTVIHDSFTGDGSTTAFVLSAAPSADQYSIVIEGGSYQDPSKYSLSGATLTFTTAPLLGAEIHVISIIATTFNTDISQYVQRTTLTLADDAQVILNSAGAVFSTVANGMYEVWDQSDPNTYGLIAFKDGTPPTFDLRDASANTVGTDTDTNLCFFVSGNNMIIRNRLGSSKTFVIHRKI